MAGRIKDRAPSQGNRISVDSRNTGSVLTQKVRVSFEHFDPDCVKDCTVAALNAWTDKLRMLTASTWGVVMNAPRKGIGHEKIPRNDLNFSIPPICRQRDFFLSFHCGDDDRMIGYQDEGVLQIVWIAPGCGAYEH